MKWERNAQQGLVVAGAQGQGKTCEHLHWTCGILVDSFGLVYAVDQKNARVMRWSPGARAGKVIVGGNGQG